MLQVLHSLVFYCGFCPTCDVLCFASYVGGPSYPLKSTRCCSRAACIFWRGMEEWETHTESIILCNEDEASKCYDNLPVYRDIIHYREM